MYFSTCIFSMEKIISLLISIKVQKKQFLDLPSISVRKDGISPSEEVYASIAPSNHERDWSPSKGHRGLRARFLESQGLPKDKRGNIRI